MTAPSDPYVALYRSKKCRYIFNANDTASHKATPITAPGVIQCHFCSLTLGAKKYTKAKPSNTRAIATGHCTILMAIFTIPPEKASAVGPPASTMATAAISSIATAKVSPRAIALLLTNDRPSRTSCSAFKVSIIADIPAEADHNEKISPTDNFEVACAWFTSLRVFCTNVVAEPGSTLARKSSTAS